MHKRSRTSMLAISCKRPKKAKSVLREVHHIKQSTNLPQDIVKLVIPYLGVYEATKLHLHAVHEQLAEVESLAPDNIATAVHRLRLVKLINFPCSFEKKCDMLRWELARYA
jgi:hypothetical protein